MTEYKVGDTGTLAELGVREGDVVAVDHIEDFRWYGASIGKEYTVEECGGEWKWCGIRSDHWHMLHGNFRLISRAPDTGNPAHGANSRARKRASFCWQRMRGAPLR